MPDSFVHVRDELTEHANGIAADHLPWSFDRENDAAARAVLYVIEEPTVLRIDVEQQPVIDGRRPRPRTRAVEHEHDVRAISMAIDRLIRDSNLHGCPPDATDSRESA